MKVYVDVLFFINFFFDFFLLSGTAYLLKRKVKIRNLFLGALVGEISCLILFLPLSTISLLLVKLLTSIFMILTSFGYRDYFYFKKNILYFYLLSILLGGVIYFLKLSLNTPTTDIVTNLLVLIIISPYLLYKYLKEEKNYHSDYSLRHTIEIYLQQKKYTYTAYLDTGNCLEDPYKKRPIILVYDNALEFTYEKSILVPYKTVEYEGVLKCQKPDKVVIDHQIEVKNILIGQSKKRFNIEGIDVILPNIIKEEIK